tara:strand:- start:2187 stop:2351 length:165 start_codon:yes stop_codon:yes gene_type:complete
MKNKTTDYILGMITGIAIMIAAYSCTSPLSADGSSISSTRGDYEWNPIYVKVVE